MKYGIQMFSLRDITEKDMDSALKAVAEMGYKQIEFAGFFGHSAEEIVAMLKKYDLELIGTHSDWESLRDNYEETIAFHKALGNKRYIIPRADIGTMAQMDEFVAFLEVTIPKMREEGIEVLYHNHHFEFLPTEEGYHIYNELVNRTELGFELDTYLAYVAGVTAVEELERLGSRVKMIHLKDGDPEGHSCSLGSGSAPIAAVRAKAIEMGIDIVVECEILNPTGIEVVSRCMDFLKTLD